MSLQKAARRFLARAGQDGATLADAIAALGPDVPAATVAGTKARMERANGTCSDPLRRVVQDTLNRLVTNKVAEAAGEGDDRRYRLTTEARTVIRRPKPRLETIRLDDLTFDRACQQRADGLYDEATVERYVELIRDEKVEFPPLEAVWEKKAGTNWVFGGFHRGEAYRRCGANSVEVLVYDGTKQDAILYSLAENGTHGRNRTAVDVQRTLATAILDTTVRGRILETARDEGGVHRAIQAATGVSKGAIYLFLKAHGLKASRDGRLTKAEPPAGESSPKPGRTSPSANETPVQDDGDEDSEPRPAPGKNQEPVADEPIIVGGAPDHVRAALLTRKRADQLIATLTDAAKQLDAICSSGGAGWMTGVATGDGEHVLRQVPTRKGEQASAVWTNAGLTSLIRLLKRGRVASVCAGCRGKGCRNCRDLGYLPEAKELLPLTGQATDLFSVDAVGDIWG